ncbi:MAG: DUF4382 domain-containing protein [Candidatus Acidiferrales bacterium]
MPRCRTLCAIAGLVSFICMPGCGKDNGPIVGGGNNAQISLTIHDAPPLGTTVLSLQVQVKSAMLQPGNVSITLPETVELTQLQSDTTLLSSLQIPSGTYTSLTIDFENPTLIFINNTGGPITPNQNPTCAAGAICTITPVEINGNTFTFTTAPFPLNIAPNAEVGLELDVDMADLVRPDFSLDFSNGGSLSIAQLASVQGAAEIRRLRHVLGTVKLVQTNFFSFTTPTGVLMGIDADSNTIFNFPGCIANNFSCVKANQVLEVDISLEGNGTLLAKEVDLEADVSVEEISGLIVSLGPGSPPSNFQMLVRQASPAVTIAAVGAVETIGIGAGTTFAVDHHSFVLPGGLTFTSAAGLLVGQEMLADVTIVQAPSLVITTKALALRRSQVTALVSTAPTPGGSTFVLNPLPSLFQTALPTNILSLQVDTTAQTVFENLTPNTIAGVLQGNNVSVGGFLFNTQPSPGTFRIAVDAVRGQPLPGP